MASPNPPNAGMASGTGADITDAELVDQVLSAGSVTDGATSSEALPQTESDPSPAPPVKPQRNAGAFPMVLGGVVAAALGFGAAVIAPKYWPAAGNADLSATVAAQAAQISRLSETLQALPAPPPPVDLAPLEARLAEIASRLTEAEAAISVPHPIAEDPAPRLAALEARIASLEVLPPGTVLQGATGADPAALASLRQDLAAVHAEVAAQAGSAAAAVAEVKAAADAARLALSDAKAQAERLGSETEAARADAAARAALGRIEAAVETGSPFASAIEALKSGGVTVPEGLQTGAASGVATLADLRTAFPEAARLALDESLRTNAGGSTIDRLGAFLRTQTGARSLTPREGDDPDAVLSRAEAALREGKLPEALTEIATLPQAGQDAIAPWAEAARLRVAATTALAALAAALGEG